jgi:hypothetical protein
MATNSVMEASREKAWRSFMGRIGLFGEAQEKWTPFAFGEP